MDANQITAIIAEAADDEAAQAASMPGAEQAAPAADPVEETKAIFAAIVALLSPLLPYLLLIYTEEKITMLAAAYVPVAEKYGWNVGGFLEQFGAEIALIGVSIPLAIQTSRAHAEFIAKKAIEKAAESAKTPQEAAEVAAVVRNARAGAVEAQDSGGVLCPA